MYRVYWTGMVHCQAYTTDSVLTKSWQDLNAECVKTNPNFPTWHKGSSIYFRHLPYIRDVVILLVMSMLHWINFLFKDTLEVKRMQAQVYESIRSDSASTENVYVLVRITNFIKMFSIWACILLMVISNAVAEVSIITSI
jgi:hypothetical protein